tara:strand:- start:317 stop:685 length:369 start_codon:yes stop_codon:yes gene_type:complete
MKNLKIILFFFFFFQNVNSQEDRKMQLEIYKNIRCLVCQGQSIADSNSDFAQTIKIVIDDKIKEGKKKDEIYEFLIRKYGEWIVYKPQLKKTNFFLWFFPYIALFLGGILILSLLKKKNNKK